MDTKLMIRSEVVNLIGKRIRGGDLTERELNDLRTYQQDFPILRNPVLVQCEIPDHRTFAVIDFPQEVNGDPTIGIRKVGGEWVCEHCGNSDHIKQEPIS